MKRYALAAVVVVLSSFGCSSGESDRGTAHEETTPMDETSMHDAELTIRFEMSELTVPAGGEAMYCEYLEPLEHDLVVSGFGTRQGEGGHHMVLYRSLVPKEPGTVEDCTSAASMANLMLALTQVTTQEPGSSSIEFPEGMVAVLPKGMQLVAQSHYINATGEPLATNDKMEIWLSERELTDLTQLHLFVSTAANFEIPAGTEAYTAKAGCNLDYDIDLLSLTPHMHEWGKAISLKAGSAEAMRLVAEVAEWEPSMRDAAPLTSLTEAGMPSAAGHFTQGESVEVSCTWANPEAHSITFPNEMCAFVGYFVSESPSATDIMCLEPR